MKIIKYKTFGVNDLYIEIELDNIKYKETITEIENQ
jgi:hypothetical protein